MNSIRLDIEGLEATETQHRVKNQLSALNGVYNVKCSEGQTYVDLNHDEEISQPEIRNHLKNNGYKIREVENLW